MIHGGRFEERNINALQVQDPSTSTVVVDRSHAFGDGINLTAVTDNIASARSESYTYTAANRLSEGDGIWGTLTWGYDSVGNRTIEVLTSGSTTTSTYNYPGSSNKLSTVMQGSSTVRAFSYDGAGKSLPTLAAARPTTITTTTATGSTSSPSAQRSPPNTPMTASIGWRSAPRRT